MNPGIATLIVSGAPTAVALKNPVQSISGAIRSKLARAVGW
jgi:hypothetical protein